MRRTRAERRAAKQKAIIRASRIYPQLTDTQHRKLADNPAPCACWMCRNPRRLGGSGSLTLQERRARLKEIDYMEEMENEM